MSVIRSELVTIEIDAVGPHRVAPDGRNEIIDGDTLMIGGQIWGISGYDMPEITGNCCEVEAARGLEAKDYLEDLILFAAANGTLRLYLTRERDRHGRRLVHIFVNDVNIGELMKLHGLAADYNGQGPKPVFCHCREALARAIRERRTFRRTQSGAR